MSQEDTPQPTGTQPHEAQRIEAWAAVHRPETTGDELARIAEEHPEFASAIAAHPNAPATQPAEQAPYEQAQPDQTLYAQHSHAQPHHAQPQYAQPQHAQPHQYAQPQYAPHQYASGPADPSRPKVNVAGIIAFSLLVVVTVLEFFVPVVMRQAMLTYNISLMIGFPLVRLILALCAIVIGIVGARMRSQPRLRWMAVGSIVAGRLLAVPLLLRTISYASPGLLPYYGY